MAQVFEQCRVAVETGILPRQGSLEDQDELFVEVFPTFVERWRARSYVRVWDDVRAFAKVLLDGLFTKK